MCDFIKLYYTPFGGETIKFDVIKTIEHQIVTDN